MEQASLNIPNVSLLIAALELLPEQRFNIRWLYSRIGYGEVAPNSLTDCGTAACIAGWCNAISGDFDGDAETASTWLGLSISAEFALFTPNGYYEQSQNFPLSRAIRTLKHMRSEFLRTGQVVVDWDAPEPEPLSEWTAPKAVELKADLPAEITRFLGSPSHVEAL